jgi:predicted O-methyltransferase YrrM
MKVWPYVLAPAAIIAAVMVVAGVHWMIVSLAVGGTVILTVGLLRLYRFARVAARRLRALVRQTDEMQKKLGRLERQIAGRLDAADRHARERHGRLLRAMQLETRQVESLLLLHELVDLDAATAPTRTDWAAAADLLALLARLVEIDRPKTIVECGAGTSTVWLGYLAQRVGARLISLEHAPEYAETTGRYLASHPRLASTVELRRAPLVPYEVAGGTMLFYDLASLADIDRIDLLVVDGPPGTVQPRSRLPAVPLLAEQLSDGAAVVLDDARRDDERQIIEAWLATGLVELELLDTRLDKGAAVLRRTR